MLNIKNGWIFSKKWDIGVFFLPLLPFLLYGAFSIFSGVDAMYFARINLVIDFFIMIFLDYPHAMSTWYRPLVADQKELSKRKFLYLGVPILAFVSIYSTLGDYGYYVMKIILYWNIFHLVRQQWGWISISDRQAGLFNKFDIFMDKLFLYTMTFGSVIWWHTQKLDHGYGFISLNDVEQLLPEYLGQYVLYFIGVVTFGYLLHFVKKIINKEIINLNKYAIIFVTFFAWFGGIVILRGDVLFIDLTHSIPYLYLIYHYCKKVVAKNQEEKESTFFQKEIFIKKYGSIIFMTFLVFLAMISYNNTEMYHNKIIEAIFLAIAVSHYIVDGFIWKSTKKENKKLLEETLNIKGVKEKTRIRDYFF